jgi:tryptophan-rich sensory protein
MNSASDCRIQLLYYFHGQSNSLAHKKRYANNIRKLGFFIYLLQLLIVQVLMMLQVQVHFVILRMKQLFIAQVIHLKNTSYSMQALLQYQ